MATRLYQPSTGAAAVSPAYDSWSKTSGADALACVLVKISSAMENQTSDANSTGASQTLLVRQYVSAPLAAQTISGTVKSYLRALANGSNVDARLSIRVCNNAGTSFTGTLLSLADYSSGNELNTSLRNKPFADGDTLSSLAINNGDRLVIEYGGATGTTGRTATINFGDDSGTDLPEDETTTAANNPWIEFSGTLVWASASATVADQQILSDSVISVKEYARTSADQLGVVSDASSAFVDVLRSELDESLDLSDAAVISLQIAAGLEIAIEAVEAGLAMEDVVTIAIWPVYVFIVEQAGLEDTAELRAEFFRAVGDPGETYFGEGFFGESEFGGEQWLDSLSDGAAVIIQRQMDVFETELLPDIPDTVEQLIRYFRESADPVELLIDEIDIRVSKFYTISAGADRCAPLADGADVTIPTVLMNPNRTHGHYRPRWLVSGTISGETRRYSSEDMEV